MDGRVESRPYLYMEYSRENIIAEFEPERAQTAKKTKLLVVPGLVMGLGGLGLGLIMALIIDDTSNFFPVIFILIGILGLILFCIGSTVRNRFKKQLVMKIESAIIKKYFPDAKRDLKNGLNIGDIMFPGFFAQPDRYETSDFLSATWNGIPFKRSKYNLQRRETHHSKNGTTVSYVTYAQGTMFFFDFEREFGSTIKILEKHGVNGFVGKGLKNVETEYIAFNKKFQILTDNENDVFYILTPQIQEKIMALEPLYEGDFYMAFIGSDLWVAINDSNQSYKINVAKPLTDEVIKQIEFICATPKVIVDNLGLSKDKFKKNAGIK